MLGKDLRVVEPTAMSGQRGYVCAEDGDSTTGSPYHLRYHIWPYADFRTCVHGWLLVEC